MRNLVALAQDDEKSEESRTAAVKAVQLMRKHDLHIVSGTDLKKNEQIVAEARALAAESKAENSKAMLLGALGGYLFGGGKLP